MLPFTETVFWISFFIVFYTYAGYPLILVFLLFIKSLFRTTKPPAPVYDHPVTMIVAAYNEEDVIEEKIKNCLSLNYPPALILIFLSISSFSDWDAFSIEYASGS